jgi:catecholate siderophore receptor
MSRSSRRKKRRLAHSFANRPARRPAPWWVAGAVVASAAVGAPPAASAAQLLPGGRGLSAAAARRPPLPEFGARPAWRDDAADRRTLHGTDQVFDFDIPAGTVGDAIDAVATRTGLAFTFANDGLRSLPCAGLRGPFTARAALDRLLVGSGVGFAFTGPGTVTLDIRTSEAITVLGEAETVSSPKYTEPLRDTPQTVAVIPGRVIEEQAATSLRNALRNTPGITLTAGEGGTAPGDNLLIRGFSARNDVYIDGARDSGVVSRDTFNTEQIEVVKGPSSVVTGRGATGGSVNIVSKSAGLDNFARFNVTAGSAASGRTTADVNRQLGEHVGVRFNLMWQDAGVPRRDEVRQRGVGIAPSIAFGLGTSTSVAVSYQHLQQNNEPDYGLPATLPDVAVNQGLTIKDLDFSNFYGLPDRDHEKMRSDLGTVTVQHQFAGNLSLRNLTRYGRNELDRVVTPPRAATIAASADDPGFDPSLAQIRRTDTKYQYRDDRALINQTDLTLRFDTGRVRHAVVTGAELAHETQPSYGVTDAFSNGRPPVTDLFHPDPSDPYVPALVRTGASADGTANTVAAYAFDTIKAGERWQVDAGLRVDRVAVAFDNVLADGTATPYSRTDVAPSGRAGIVYKPSPSGSLYAAYSSSFNPAFDGSFGLSLVDRTGSIAALPPERTHNVEAGTKWNLRHDLLFTAAVFRMEKINAKTTDDAGATVLAGNQLVRGVELGVSGQLTDRWAILSGLTLMKGTVRESGVAAEVGRQLSYVPRATFNAWTSYQLPQMKLTVAGGAQFTDGYFFNNTNAFANANQAAIQDLTRYWLFDAMASYQLNPHMRLQVNGTNLANARYVDRGYTGHFIPGAGRGILIGPVFDF